MSKNERKRTMVYSNVKKKADAKSASKDKNVIDLDDEIIIGLPKTKVKNNKNIKSSKKAKIATIKNEVKEKKLTPQEKLKIQKIRVIKKISIFLFLMLFIIGGGVAFLLSPVFNIKGIDVENNIHISSGEIIKASSLNVGQNIFKTSKREIKNKVIENPYVEKVEIKRNIFSKRMKIIVNERVATLMLEYGNSYVYIDNQGYILEISQQKLNTPILKGYTTSLEDIKPGARLAKEDLEKLETVLNIIKNAEAKEIDNLITYIDIKDKKEYIMYLESEDKTVYLGKCTDLSTQMLYVKEMLEREKNIEGRFYVDMDLNTGNPVFKETV